MSAIQYRLVQDAQGSTLTVFDTDGHFTINDTHPNYDEVVELVTHEYADDYDVAEARDLADPAKTVEKHMTKLSERVSVLGGTVYFDGDPVGSTLTDHIVRLLSEGKEYGEGGWRSLVNFLEKLAANPIPHSQSRFYGWLQAVSDDELTGGFTIAEDGDVIGYKGVSRALKSRHVGPGIVNGEVFEHAALDNSVGNVVEMARSEVEHNPSQGCSTGLHIGTRSYAESWGDRVVTVKFSPTDVVSVPTDSGDAKLRVCRYTVIDADADVIESPYVSESEYSLGD